MQDHRLSPIVRVGRGLAGVMLVLGGPFSGYFLTQIFLEARDSGNWPSTAGILTKAEVRDTGMNRYRAEVAYTYRVGAKEFTGSRISASDGEFGARHQADAALRDLKVGQDVTVYYNPEKPQKAVLHAGAGVQEYVLLFIPVAMFIVGLWVCVYLWRTRELA